MELHLQPQELLKISLQSLPTICEILNPTFCLTSSSLVCLVLKSTMIGVLRTERSEFDGSFPFPGGGGMR